MTRGQGKKAHPSDEDFRLALDLRAGPGLEEGVWWVCDDYKLEPEIKGAPAYFEAAYPLERRDKWKKAYKPLETAPDLFLEFVEAFRRAGETIKNKPGKPGEDIPGVGSRNRPHPRPIQRGFRDPRTVLGFVREFGPLGVGGRLWVGGPKETLSTYIGEMIQASNLLGLYEAVLDGEKEAAETALELLPAKQIRDSERLGDNDEWYEMDPLEHALVEVTAAVERRVGELCFPSLIPPKRSHDLSKVRSGWGYTNLLGAMYLGMFWLISAETRVRRCRYCGRIISEPRANQDFCRNQGRCRNAWNHHHGTGKSGKEAKKAKREANRNKL